MISKASLTGNTDYISRWLYTFINHSYYYNIKTQINDIILEKYNDIIKIIKIFSISSRKRYESLIDIYNSNYGDVDQYLDCIKEKIYKIDEEISNETVKANDIEFRTFLKMLLTLCEDDKIMTDIFNVFKFYRISFI